MNEYMNEKIPDITESTYVKALNRIGTDRLEGVLHIMDYHLEDIYESLCNKEERLFTLFMYDLINIVKEIQAENKKNYDPDYEEWKKDPDNPIWKSNN